MHSNASESFAGSQLANFVHVQGTGQGSASTSLSNTVNIPARFPYQPQTKLYTAYLEVDSREAQNAPMPVDLVSPIPPSKAEANRADGATQQQPTALQVETRQPSMAGGMTTTAALQSYWVCRVCSSSRCAV